MQSGTTIKKGDMEALQQALKDLADLELLVGFPEDNTARKDPEDAKLGITNAALAYIHDNGAPEVKIPARPFMVPALDSVQERLADTLTAPLKTLGKSQDPEAGKRVLMRAGLIAQAAIRKKINEGIPPPLSQRTLEERASRGRKGAKQELANRAAGGAASTLLAKPLIDTGQMRNAVSFVIRPRKKRK